MSQTHIHTDFIFHVLCLMFYCSFSVGCTGSSSIRVFTFSIMSPFFHIFLLLLLSCKHYNVHAQTYNGKLAPGNIFIFIHTATCTCTHIHIQTEKYTSQHSPHAYNQSNSEIFHWMNQRMNKWKWMSELFII